MINNKTFGYKLMLDDLRDPVETYGSYGKDMIVARTGLEARRIVQERGMPSELFLDHDLGLKADGTADEAPEFIKWLSQEYWDGEQPVPDYEVHSGNPIGKGNLKFDMDGWKRFAESQLIKEESLTSLLSKDLALSSKTYPEAEKKERREKSVPIPKPSRSAKQRRLRIRK